MQGRPSQLVSGVLEVFVSASELTFDASGPSKLPLLSQACQALRSQESVPEELGGWRMGEDARRILHGLPLQEYAHVSGLLQKFYLALVKVAQQAKMAYASLKIPLKVLQDTCSFMALCDAGGIGTNNWQNSVLHLKSTLATRFKSYQVSGSQITQLAEAFQATSHVVRVLEKHGNPDVAASFGNGIAQAYVKVLLGSVFAIEDMDILMQSARDSDLHVIKSRDGNGGKAPSLPVPRHAGVLSCFSLLERLFVELDNGRPL